VRVAERDITYRDTRYVLGLGDGFVGIWDRRAPDAPIERFRTDVYGEDAAQKRVYELLFEDLLAAKSTPGLRLYLPPRPPEVIRLELPPGVRPRGMSRQMKEIWDAVAETESYSQTSGRPWLIVEEEDDAVWRVVMDFTGSGTFYLYSVGGFGEELACRGRFDTVEAAQAYAAQTDKVEGDWREVPATVPRSLLAVLRWAQRELGGGAGGPWYERFEWADGSQELHGERSFARVYENGVPVGVVIAAERGHDDEAAIYLMRPGDLPRLVYTLEHVRVLTSMVERYLGDVVLGEWRLLPDDWPRELGPLAAATLILAGLV
jgi:hypothetical protein